jgi:hypothetical protein
MYIIPTRGDSYAGREGRGFLLRMHSVYVYMQEYICLHINTETAMIHVSIYIYKYTIIITHTWYV